MPRIPKHTLVIEIFRAQPKIIQEIISELDEAGIEYLEITTRHSYGLFQTRNNTRVYTPISPFSIIDRDNVWADICRKIPELTCKKLAKDSWVEYRYIGTDDIIQLFNAINKYEGIERDRYVLRIERTSEIYDRVIIMDYMTAPLSWLRNRVLPFDHVYKESLKKYMRLYPKKIVLGFLVKEKNVLDPYMWVEKTKQKIFVKGLSPTKPFIDDLLFWQGIDAILSLEG